MHFFFRGEGERFLTRRKKSKKEGKICICVLFLNSIDFISLYSESPGTFFSLFPGVHTGTVSLFHSEFHEQQVTDDYYILYNEP